MRGVEANQTRELRITNENRAYKIQKSETQQLKCKIKKEAENN